MSEFIPATDTLRKKARTEKELSPRRVGVFMGVAFTAVIVVTLAAYFLFEALDGAMNAKSDIPVALSEDTARSCFAEAGIKAPDLSNLSYVNGENLIGPRFEEVVVESAQTAGEDDPRTRKASAVAVFNNSYVRVSMPVSATFSYDSEAIAWIGTLDEPGEYAVEPLRGPSTAGFEELALELLAAYDGELASLFEGGDIVLHPSLDKTGGTVSLDLSVTDAYGRYLTTCTATMEVTWDESAGWKLAVTDAGAPEVTDISLKHDNPAWIDCKTGDSIEISGYVDAAGASSILRCNSPIPVTLDGEKTDASVFELVSSHPISVHAGAFVIVSGTISKGSGTAPFTISVTSVRS